MTSYIKNNLFKLITANIILIYAVGILTITFSNDSMRGIILGLTPVNLIMNLVMLLTFHKIWDRSFILSSLFIALLGYFIEVIGVKTGAIFGNYTYGENLGVKVFDVPIIMSLNWFILVYSAAVILNKVKNILLFSFLGATLITLLDVFMEPLSAKLDFWYWDLGAPIQNFIAWYLFSLVLFIIFRKINGSITNPLAKIVLLLHFIFFIILNVVFK